MLKFICFVICSYFWQTCIFQFWVYHHKYSCLHLITCILILVCISSFLLLQCLFSSPTGSPRWPDLDQTYPMSLSDDLREDALHELLERIDIREGLTSPNPWSGWETELRQCRTQSFINSLEAQTQQSPQVEQEPVGVEQGAQCESHHVSIDTTPQVCCFRDDSGSWSHRTHDMDNSDGLVYVSFNLQNINAPVPPKWKHNDHILEEYKKFHRSCQCTFGGPMACVTSGKVKTNMFLIWCGPNGEDIYDNFQLNDNEMYDIDYVMEQFELYCDPICNFQAARYQVSQCENETMNAFYHCIQKLCIQF